MNQYSLKRVSFSLIAFISNKLHAGICFLIADVYHEDLFIRYFEKQFELAEAMKLPMFLHMRAAADDFCEIFARNKAR